MKANESVADRVIRVVLGLVLLYLGWSGMVTGGWGAFFKIIGFVPLLTGIVGWCPIYALLRISTKPKST
jgi:hypothetical protein